MFLNFLLYIFLGVSLLLYFIGFIRILLVFVSLFLEVPYIPLKRKTVKKVEDCLNLSSGDSVLEVGSGTGRNLFYLSKIYPDIRFTGLEIHPVLVPFSKLKKKLFRRENLEFKNINALKYKEYGKHNKVFFFMYSGFSGELMEYCKKQLEKRSVVISAVYDFGKKFSEANNIETFVVEYIYKEEKIFRWVK